MGVGRGGEVVVGVSECVCERESEREREKDKGREREKWRWEGERDGQSELVEMGIKGEKDTNLDEEALLDRPGVKLKWTTVKNFRRNFLKLVWTEADTNSIPTKLTSASSSSSTENERWVNSLV